MSTLGQDPPPPEPETPALTRTERRERAAADALRTLVRDLTAEASMSGPADLEPIALQLQLQAVPGETWQLAFDPPLAEQLSPQLEDALADRGVYQPGAVYDYRTGSSREAGCTPPTPLSVFDGYDAMGVPQWCDFPQALLQAGEERVDQLYTQPPRLLARQQSGKELNKEQLTSFGRGSKTYVVLGQVVAGWLELPAALAGRDGDRRLAITIQAVETRGLGRATRLHLNALAVVPSGLNLRDLFGDDWAPGVARAFRSAERDLQRLEKHLAAARESKEPGAVNRVMRNIPGLLRSLTHGLERSHQQARRRTRHAEERRQSQRPIHKAVEDLQHAQPEQVFFDEKERTLMVCGRHHRAHAFNSTGRHVTSFTLSPSSVAFRLRTRRWRPATAGEFEALKQSAP